MASPFKRLNFESLQKDPEWQQYKYYINKKNINLLQDSMYNRRMNFPQRVAILGQVIPEKGGDTGEHGNGAFGMLGWRGNRRLGLDTKPSTQIHKIMNEVYNTNKQTEWNHGGSGTGVQTGREMQQLFRDTQNVEQAAKAFMKGYVRPEQSERDKRVKFTKLLKRHMK